VILRRILFPVILLLLAYGFWLSPEFKQIAAGVAIFLFGMLALEEGFRTFTGGVLERILRRSTDRLWKSLGFGFVTTALMQSSSLVSILTISFLSAGLIGLAQGIGIIFGANLGTTTGAWLIATLGLKVKISAYAMPMLVFGVIFIFQKNRTLKGIGYVLAGLGFFFLGIHYMKEGFSAFKSTIDLSAFSVGGLKGLLIYTGLGILATVVMQSSHATLVLIITALAAGQVSYENALALAIGANVGTTITAILGSLSANAEGKRLAAAHLIFNLTTGLIAIIFIRYFVLGVEAIAETLGISQEDYTLKLAIFHTLFNLVGILVMIPFISLLVRFLEGLFRPKAEPAEEEDRARYLNDAVLEFPSSALAAIREECLHLYDNAFEIIARGLRLDPVGLRSRRHVKELLSDSCRREPVDIDRLYNLRLKGLYGAIIDFATRAQASMPDSRYGEEIFRYKIACRHIIEAVKAVKHLQKNLDRYCGTENPHIQKEYRKMIKRIAKLLRRLDSVARSGDPAEIERLLEKGRKLLRKNDVLANGSLDRLIRERLISNEMATSLMNDNLYVSTVISGMLSAAEILFDGKESETEYPEAELEEENGERKPPQTVQSPSAASDAPKSDNGEKRHNGVQSA
jgi:phosphate:Na+ symporter